MELPKKDAELLQYLLDLIDRLMKANDKAEERFNWSIAQDWSRHHNLDGICNEALDQMREILEGR